MTLCFCSVVHTRVEVDVSQHVCEVVCVYDEVAHTLITKLWTLHVRVPRRYRHPVNTDVSNQFQSSLHFILDNLQFHKLVLSRVIDFL